VNYLDVSRGSPDAPPFARAGVARSYWSRFKGLMFQAELPEGEALLIDPCSSVHTFFMRFPIDVVFLDKNDCVVKIAAALGPYRAAMGGGGKKVLEMPPGAAAKAGIAVGEALFFRERAEEPAAE
jgi:uncharacterized membrane protein (UPF0127 family)